MTKSKSLDKYVQEMKRKGHSFTGEKDEHWYFHYWLTIKKKEQDEEKNNQDQENDCLSSIGNNNDYNSRGKSTTEEDCENKCCMKCTNPITGQIIRIYSNFGIYCTYHIGVDTDLYQCNVEGIHKHVYVPGNFDHLHEGHKQLLMSALEHTSNDGELTIDIMPTHATNGRDYAYYMESEKTRRNRLKEYLSPHLKPGQTLTISIIDITDDGDLLYNNELISLLVFGGDYAGYLKVNLKRMRRGLCPIEFLRVPLVMDYDGLKLSSTSIRCDIAAIS